MPRLSELPHKEFMAQATDSFRRLREALVELQVELERRQYGDDYAAALQVKRRRDMIRAV